MQADSIYTHSSRILISSLSSASASASTLTLSCVKDGIHSLALPGLFKRSSITLGPAFLPVLPAVELDGGILAVAVQAGEVWLFNPSNAGEEKKKSVVVLPEGEVALACHRIASSALVVFSSGICCVVSLEGQLRSFSLFKSVKKTATLAGVSITSSSAVGGVIVTALVSVGGKTKAVLFTLSAELEVQEFNLQQTDGALALSASADGSVTVVMPESVLHFPSHSSISSTPQGPNSHPFANLSSCAATVSIVKPSPDFAIISFTRDAAPHTVLLDCKLGAVLHEADIAGAAVISGGSVYLTHLVKKGQFVVSSLAVDVPAKSTLRGAMGTKVLTQKWCARPAHKSAELSDVQRIRNAFRVGVKAGEIEFDSWIEVETNAARERLESKRAASKAQDAAADSDSDAMDIVERDGSDLIHETQPLSLRKLVKASIDPDVARALLDALFSEQNYSSRVVGILLSRKCICASTNPDLMTQLLSRKDWFNVRLALQHVPDLTEYDLMQALAEIAKADEAGDSETFISLLPQIIVYSSTASLLKLALRKSLTEVNSIMRVLQVCQSKLEAWLQQRSFEVSAADTAVKVKSRRKKSHQIVDSIPSASFGKTINFLTCMLDALFPTLLMYKPSHPVVSRLNTLIEEISTRQETLIDLRGQLGIFSLYQREEEEGGKSQEGGNKSRRSRAIEANGRVAGYSVDEFWI